MQKKFISIHKPPASIRFAPIKHALAVTVEPLKFSPAGGLGIELQTTNIVMIDPIGFTERDPTLLSTPASSYMKLHEIQCRFHEFY